MTAQNTSTQSKSHPTATLSTTNSITTDENSTRDPH